MKRDSRTEKKEDIPARISEALTARGLSATSLEDGRSITRGYMSKLLKDGRKSFRISPEKLQVLATKLHVSYHWLSTGLGSMNDPAPTGGVFPGMIPTLENTPGYHDLEIEVGRRHPEIPLEVFRQARGLMFGSGGPDSLSVDDLEALILWLNRTRQKGSDEPAGKRRGSEKHSRGGQ